MRLKITLSSNSYITLPKGFNRYIQALIYSLLDDISADWLHNTGFKYEKRTFKHFVFSSILEKGRYDKKNDQFLFGKNISFIISSPIDWILEQVAKNGVMKTEMNLGKNKLQMSSLEILEKADISENKVRIQTLTPVEVHSTLLKGDGSKKTYYYSPMEKEYSELINDNLQKKWCALNEKESCPYLLKAYPVKKELMKRTGQNFKDFYIQGWRGHFWLEGDRELIELALESGIGSRNSAGFGMISVVGKR